MSKICEKAIITIGASQSERRKGIAKGDVQFRSSSPQTWLSANGQACSVTQR